MDKKAFYLVAAVLIFAAFFASSYLQSQQARDVLGGDRDEHGCIGSAGYSWCEQKQKCLRQWEEPCMMACTEEAKICPDGSAVGRNGSNNCEFDPCPESTDSGGGLIGGNTGMANPAAEYCREMGYDYRIVDDASGQRGECLTKEGVWVDEWALYRREMDVVVPPTDPLAEKCRAAGGNWNECGNRCMYDNQGKEGVACNLMCESLCECGGVAGYRCPEGYACIMPAGVADALGYCIPKVSVAQAT